MVNVILKQLFVEMLSTFNCGVGLTVVVSKGCEDQVIRRISEYFDCYKIGTIIEDNQRITFKNHMVL